MLTADKIREHFTDYAHRLSEVELLVAKYLAEQTPEDNVCQSLDLSRADYHEIAARPCVEALRWLLTALYATASAENCQMAYDNMREANFMQARTIRQLQGGLQSRELH